MGRKLTERWFVKVRWAGYIRPGNQSYSTRGSQWRDGGKIGYRVRSQTIVGSMQTADYYGLTTGDRLGRGWRGPGNARIQLGRASRHRRNAPARHLGNEGFRINAGINRSYPAVPR